MDTINTSVIFLVGMPGCGKSTLTLLVSTKLARLKPGKSVGAVEMSAVVKTWLAEKNDSVSFDDMVRTELHSQRLQGLLYERMVGDFTVVSGVREWWLIEELDKEKVVVFLRLDASDRMRRYIDVGKNLSQFAKAEQRAIDMGVHKMEEKADIIFFAQSEDPNKTAEEVIDAIFDSEKKYFIHHESRSTE